MEQNFKAHIIWIVPEMLERMVTITPQKDIDVITEVTTQKVDDKSKDIIYVDVLDSETIFISDSLLASLDEWQLRHVLRAIVSRLGHLRLLDGFVSEIRRLYRYGIDRFPEHNALLKYRYATIDDSKHIDSQSIVYLEDCALHYENEMYDDNIAGISNYLLAMNENSDEDAKIRRLRKAEAFLKHDILFKRRGYLSIPEYAMCLTELSDIYNKRAARFNEEIGNLREKDLCKAPYDEAIDSMKRYIDLSLLDSDKENCCLTLEEHLCEVVSKVERRLVISPYSSVSYRTLQDYLHNAISSGKRKAILNDSEIQEYINMVIEEEKAERPQEASDDKENPIFDWVCAFALKAATDNLNEQKTGPAMVALERARWMVDTSENEGMMRFRNQALVRVYPLLAYCYLKTKNWEKALFTINSYIELLGQVLENDGIPFTSARESEVDRLYRLMEIVGTHYRSLDDRIAINYMLQADKIVSKYGNGLTKSKYYAFLTKCHRGGGDVKEAEKTYGRFEESCTASAGVAVSKDVKAIKDELEYDGHFVWGASKSGRELIHDYIESQPYLCFDLNDLMRILRTHDRLCYLDIDKKDYPQFSRLINYFMKTILIDQSELLALVLQNGGSPDEAHNLIISTLFGNTRIRHMLARKNPLDKTSSIRIYFFKESKHSQQDPEWLMMLEEAVAKRRSEALSNLEYLKTEKGFDVYRFK